MEIDPKAASGELEPAVGELLTIQDDHDDHGDVISPKAYDKVEAWCRQHVRGYTGRTERVEVGAVSGNKRSADSSTDLNEGPERNGYLGAKRPKVHWDISDGDVSTDEEELWGDDITVYDTLRDRHKHRAPVKRLGTTPQNQKTFLLPDLSVQERLEQFQRALETVEAETQDNPGRDGESKECSARPNYEMVINCKGVSCSIQGGAFLQASHRILCMSSTQESADRVTEESNEHDVPEEQTSEQEGSRSMVIESQSNFSAQASCAEQRATCLIDLTSEVEGSDSGDDSRDSDFIGDA